MKRVEISRHIVVDPQICHGQPTFKGTRILVADIVELVAAGHDVDEVVSYYPHLSRAMVQDALKHAARVIRGERDVHSSKVPA